MITEGDKTVPYRIFQYRVLHWIGFYIKETISVREKNVRSNILFTDSVDYMPTSQEIVHSRLSKNLSTQRKEYDINFEYKTFRKILYFLCTYY